MYLNIYFNNLLMPNHQDNYYNFEGLSEKTQKLCIVEKQTIINREKALWSNLLMTKYK